MGRFGNLWASGKFVTAKQEEPEKFQEQETIDVLATVSPEFNVSSASREILNALKPRRGQETVRWLRDLAPQAETPSNTAQANTPLSIFEEEVSWMDAIFNQFVHLTFEFNKTAAGTDLLVSCERPTVREKRTDELWYRPVTKTYQGRITTREWALIVRGRDGKVSVFLMPASMVLAFCSDQLSDAECSPFMEMVRSDVHASWTIAGEVAPTEAIPHLAKELFGDLIRVASGVMEDSELFASQTGTLALGKNLAVGYDQQQASCKKSPTVSQNGKLNIADMDLSAACDVVDEVIERELKRLYTEAGQLSSQSADGPALRLKISAVETFRTQILSNFEEYTKASHGLPAAALEPAPELAG